MLELLFIFIAIFAVTYFISGKEDKVSSIDQSNEGLLRGTAFVEHKRERREHEITIGGVPLSDESCSKHIAYAGSTGTGKSKGMTEALMTIGDRVDQRGDLMICIDNSGEFMSRFFMDGDKILNPFDKRSVLWNPFNEIRDSRIDFRMIAKSLYPAKANSQPEWDDFAKNLFSNVFQKLRENGSRSAGEFMRLITMADKEELEDFLKGTSSSITSSAENSRMFASVRSTLANALDTWMILEDGGNFSIRNWVRNHDGESQVLWIPYMPSHKASLEFLIAGWIDLAINEVLSLGENRKRKIWLLIDELVAIGKIQSIIDGLTLGRKPGLSVLVGFQSIAQLKKLYGEHDAQTIVSNVRNKLVLGQGSHLDATFWAEELGKRDWVQREGGDNTGSAVNDGKSSSSWGDSTSYRVRTDFAVTPSELLDLPDMEGYLRVAGAGGITRVITPFNELPIICEPYIPEGELVEGGN